MPYSVGKVPKYRCTKKSLSRMMQYFVGKVRTYSYQGSDDAGSLG